MYCSISALSCSFEFVVVVGGGSQRLLSFYPTKVSVDLLLGLSLLLGCDYSNFFETSPNVIIKIIKKMF